MNKTSKVCRACDHNGRVMSIVYARSLELAVVYWQGAGIVPHTTEEVEMPEDHPTGVMPIYTAPEPRIGIKLINRSVPR